LAGKNRSSCWRSSLKPRSRINRRYRDPIGQFTSRRGGVRPRTCDQLASISMRQRSTGECPTSGWLESAFGSRSSGRPTRGRRWALATQVLWPGAYSKTNRCKRVALGPYRHRRTSWPSPSDGRVGLLSFFHKSLPFFGGVQGGEDRDLAADIHQASLEVPVVQWTRLAERVVGRRDGDLVGDDPGMQ